MSDLKIRTPRPYWIPCGYCGANDDHTLLVKNGPDFTRAASFGKCIEYLGKEVRRLKRGRK